YNAKYLSEMYDAPIALHKDDVYLVNQLTSESIMKSCNYKSFAYRVVMKFIKPLMKKVSERIATEFEEFLPNVLIEDEMRLDTYGVEATLLLLPGHTKGSIAIITDQGDCIVGDTYANLKKPQIAMNALDFKQLTDSVNKLSAYSIKMMYPGHGKPYVKA
ncbi:MBL fold metallo-hydrolase, partial [Anaerosporobacter sp.]